MKIISRRNIISVLMFVFIFSVFFSFSNYLFAADVDTNTVIKGKLENPLSGAKNLNTLFKNIIDVVLQIGVIIAGVSIMYGGFLLVTAQGNEEKVKAGRDAIQWAVIGTAVLLGAKVIYAAIEGTINSLN